MRPDYSEEDYLARVWVYQQISNDKKIPPLMRLTKSEDPPMMMGSDPKWEKVNGVDYFMGSTNRIVVGVLWLFEHLPENLHFAWMYDLMEKVGDEHRAMLGIKAKETK